MCLIKLFFILYRIFLFLLTKETFSCCTIYLIFKDNKYTLDQSLETERKKSILEKFNCLRKNQ